MATCLRILLAVDSYPPVPKAGGIQMRDLADAMAALGHEVTVLAPDPGISQPVVIEAGGARIVRVRAPDTKNVGRATRAINEFRLSGRLWKGLCSLPESAQGVDMFVWYSPTIFLGGLARRMKRRGAFCYLILRDIFPDWARETGALGVGPAYWGFKGFEWLQYAAADVIGVQSPNNLAYFDKYPTRAKREVLHNWRNLTKPLVRKEALASYGLMGRKVLVFGGTMGVAQDLDNLLRLASTLQKDSDIAILMVGEGSEKARLQGVVKQRGLNNVVIAPGLPEAQFEALLAECTAGLISLDARLTSHNIPGKLLSYLKMGLPVLASINPGNDLGDLLISSGAGLATINGDDAGLLAAALSLCGDTEERQRKGQNAEQLGRRQFAAESAAAQIIAAATTGR